MGDKIVVVNELIPNYLYKLPFPSGVQCTVKPSNNGHFGDEHFVHCSEVVLSSEVEMYGPLFRVSIIRGSTV